MTKITSRKQLDEMIDAKKGRLLECFVLLNYGLRSSKDICHEGDDYYIYNEIDDSEEVVKKDELDDHIIGEAMRKGAFYSYDF